MCKGRTSLAVLHILDLLKELFINQQTMLTAFAKNSLPNPALKCINRASLTCVQFIYFAMPFDYVVSMTIQSQTIPSSLQNSLNSSMQNSKPLSDLNRLIFFPYLVLNKGLKDIKHMTFSFMK